MPSLSEADRKAILELARRAVMEAVSPTGNGVQIPKEATFQERSALFVTLHVAKRLHGCIGVFETKELLGECLVRCARSAAIEDPRFRPMKPEELADLEIEVSLLSPLQPIRPEEIEIGKHGLLIELRMRRGLLLPQVAVEHRLSREQFLRETCHKAGLPADAWMSEEAKLYGFTCAILAEAAQEPRKQEARAEG